MSTKLRAETMSADAASGRVVQRVFVMRHGEREDSRNPLWKKTAARPYDTPITGRGEREARLISGERFSDKTATQASLAIGLEGVHLSNYMCEILTPGMTATTPEVPCKDITSYGVTIIQSDDRGLPVFPETLEQAIMRYKEEINRLADKHWPDNLLLVTHEYGVNSAMSLGGTMEPTETVYCGSVELVRSQQEQHNWTIEHYHGVFKYDIIIE